MSGFHTTRAAKANGSTRVTSKGGCYSPRMAVSYSKRQMEMMTWWAHKKGIPVAQLCRDAMFAYLECVRPDFEREMRESGDQQEASHA